MCEQKCNFYIQNYCGRIKEVREERLPEMNDSCDSSAKGKDNQLNNRKSVCL